MFEMSGAKSGKTIDLNCVNYYGGDHVDFPVSACYNIWQDKKNKAYIVPAEIEAYDI